MADILSKYKKALAPNYRHVHSGKVRESFDEKSEPWPIDYRLVMATDRISIFDFVLGFEIPQKGEVLTAMNIFWRLYLRKKIPKLRDDLEKYGKELGQFLPTSLQKNKNFLKRTVRVRNLRAGMIDVEAIVRFHLTGSAWAAYNKQTGDLWGHQLPLGLQNGSFLPAQLFTPTTKAHSGHDKPILIGEFREKYGDDMESWAHEICWQIYSRLRESGIIGADFKLEFGLYPMSKVLVLADEVGTPDSSRFWKIADYEKHFPASLPPALDKEYVRQWGREQGVDKLDPENPEHRELVRNLKPPPELINKTRELYLKAFEQIVGMPLPKFQRDVMGI